jgi:hypothetical protein
MDFALGSKVEARRSDIEFELERFRNHAAQNAREAADWNAAFRNWMLSWRKRKGEHGAANGYRSAWHVPDDGMKRG